jgi:hypothetical protein
MEVGVSNKIEIVLYPDRAKNYLVTTAVGEPYSSDFKTYMLPSWEAYCKKYGIGLAIVTKELILTNDKYYKNINWQKWLIGSEFLTLDNGVNNICYLDTDFLISPLAPNIFKFHNEEKINVVSLRRNLPFNYDVVLKKVAFFRNKFYDKKYPLDSGLFISIDDLYGHHNLEVPKIADETCAGMYVINVKKYAKFFEEAFYLYPRNTKSITNGGDQTHFNYHVLNSKVNFLSYKFQAIWVFEQAMKYPFLYDKPNSELINKCIETVLCDNYFLHFAGSWFESSMWKNDNILTNETIKLMEDFSLYLSKDVLGSPLGKIAP